MAINTSLLIAAPMLQDYLVDNATGLPLAGGTITLFQDNSRTTLKNWYYQTGIPGNYTYITLPNPLTLSSVGTITDNNGNDTIPFYYPYDETDNSNIQTYYIIVRNSNGQQQFSRQNFPFLGKGNIPAQNSGVTNKNLIVNNAFFRNIGSVNISSTDTVLVPSQHEGYNSSMADMHFIKNTTDAMDSVTFYPFVSPPAATAFDDQVLSNDVTPEFYMNLNCTGIGTETSKYLQIPLALHLKSLSGFTNGTFAIQAMNLSGNINNKIKISLYTYYGTGAVSPLPIVEETLSLTNSWTKYLISIPIPTAQNLSLGIGGDDAYFLQINYPTAVTCDINIALPSFYLSNTIPVNDFVPYDQIASTINNARTGDVRTSLNVFYPFGWVPMNDGTIGNSSSNATARANIDTWPLFNLIWSTFSFLANATSIIQIYTSAGAASTYGASAIADFSANKQISLTKVLGRALLGGLDNRVAGDQTGQSITGYGVNILNVASTSIFFTGVPIILTTTGALPTGLVANNVYYAIVISSTQISLAATYSDAMAGNVITFPGSGTGTNSIFTYLTGTFTDEFAHTQLISELANHNHPGSTMPFVNTINQASIGGTTLPTSSGNTSIVVAAQGGGTAFNIVQKSTFFNMFIKL